MSVKEILEELESKGNPKVMTQNWRSAGGENQFGVKSGDIRAIAKRLKTNHPLALELWKTGNADARQIAILILKPKELSTDDLHEMLTSTASWQVIEWLISYVVKAHPEKETVREQWMSDANSMVARAGWSLTTERIGKSPEGLDLGKILDRLEKEMGSAHDDTKWAMNFSLLEIGVKHPEYRDRAIAIGEKIGAYIDYPVSKGCITPYAPIAIRELAARQ